MKKLLCVVMLVVAIGGGAAVAQVHSLDLVVLVDTSESMLPYWHDTTDYLIRNILTGVLKKGDTFHLVSFAGHPELEISRKIESQGDIHAILARYLLLQPLGRYTDLVAAIQYLYQYVIDLPLSTQKEIIILTDGIDDPPPDSSFPISGAGGANIRRDRQLIVETAQAMRRQGWQVHIIQYPIAGTQAAGPAQPGVQLLSGSETTARAGTPGGRPAPAAPPAAGTTGAAGAGSSTRASSGGAPAAGSAQTGAGAPVAGRTQAAGGTGTTAGEQGARPAGGPGAAGGAGSPAPAGPGSATAAPSGSGAANEGKAPLLKALSQTLGVPIQQYNGVKKENLANVATGSPAVLFPKNLGRVGYRTSVPFVIRNFQQQAVFVRLRGIIYDGANILRRPVDKAVAAKGEVTLNAPIQLPASLSPGPQSIDVELQFSDSLHESPHSGTLSFTLRRSIIRTGAIAPYLLPILIGLVLVAVVVLVVLFFRRIVDGLRTSPSIASAPPVRYDAAKGIIQPIELRVIGQNPNIGGRNIHPIGSGGRRGIGGGSSAFLIYLYPCPAHIAEIVRDGDDYVLVPLRPEFFPSLTGELRGCIGKEILVQTDKGHRVTMTFRVYVSPLDEVNRIMHLVDRPGTPTAEVT